MKKIFFVFLGSKNERKDKIRKHRKKNDEDMCKGCSETVMCEENMRTCQKHMKELEEECITRRRVQTAHLTITIWLNFKLFIKGGGEN
ncbi:MAG: hypothetical protein LBL71_02020 [Endomicrobium sp.]|nr:hypothetical protein [Endomicrobium sp.]